MNFKRLSASAYAKHYPTYLDVSTGEIHYDANQPSFEKLAAVNPPASLDRRFTIYGNQENIKGNPIPYFRQTQASSRFNKNARRYHAWKDYVRKAANISDKLVTEGKLTMDIKVYFKDKTHGDSDNIFKGIADAMFKNDKYLSGSFDFDYDINNPRVEVTINT